MVIFYRGCFSYLRVAALALLLGNALSWAILLSEPTVLATTIKKMRLGPRLIE